MPILGSVVQVAEGECLGDRLSLRFSLLIFLVLKTFREEHDQGEQECQNRAEKRIQRVEIGDKFCLKIMKSQLRPFNYILQI